MHFTGHVDSTGAVKLDGGNGALKHSLSKLRGKRIRLTVEAEKTHRTSPQNRRFFGVIVPVAMGTLNRELEKRGSDTRLTKDDAHTWIDERFLGFVETDLGRFRRHCSELSTVEFSNFCDEVELYFMTNFGATFDATPEMVQEAGL